MKLGKNRQLEYSELDDSYCINDGCKKDPSRKHKIKYGDFLIYLRDRLLKGSCKKTGITELN